MKKCHEIYFLTSLRYDIRMIFLESFEHSGKFAELLPEKGTLSFANIINAPEKEIADQVAGIYIIIKNTVFAIYQVDGAQYFQADNYPIKLDEHTRIYLNRSDRTLFRDNFMDKIGLRHVFKIFRGNEALMTYKYLLSDTLNRRPLTIHTQNNNDLAPQGGESLDFFLYARNLLNNPDRRKRWFSRLHMATRSGYQNLERL